MDQVAVADGLFTWPSDDPRLIGSRCRECGTATFPKQLSCPRCTGRDVEETLLPSEGTLYTWTVQAFQPKSPYLGPEPFEPYGVGYIELAGAVRVEARLTEADPERLCIGDAMRLVIVPFRTDDQGREVMTFAFEPARTGGTGTWT